MADTNKKYLESALKYHTELYNELSTQVESLGEEPYENYLKLLLSASMQECLVYMKALGDCSKQLFNEELDIQDNIAEAIKEAQQAFMVEDGELVNVSGMAIGELKDFLKEAVQKRNTGE